MCIHQSEEVVVTLFFVFLPFKCFLQRLKYLKTQKDFNVITNTANLLDTPKDSTTQREISTRKWNNVHWVEVNLSEYV